LQATASPPSLGPTKVNSISNVLSIQSNSKFKYVYNSNQ
jgi:hypothetical protein